MDGPAPKRRAAGSRRQLTAVAIDCFARYGYQGTSIDRIARAAGVTKGALYYHFRDKEELLFEAVKDRIDGFERRVIQEVTPLKDPAAALEQIARSCVFHATVSNHRRFILTLMVEALDTNPRLSAEFREIMRRFRSFLAGIIAEGQERGAFRRDVAPTTAARLFTSGIVGAEIQYYQDPEEIELQDVIDEFVGQFVAWLAGPEASAEARATREGGCK